MSKMTYKGYTARVQYDDRDSIFVGRILGITDIIGFHAETVAGLRTAFLEAVDDYLDTCKARQGAANRGERQDDASGCPRSAPRRLDCFPGRRHQSLVS